MTISTEILLACASIVDPSTMNALVKTESAYNPYAIAVVDGSPLVKQPKTKEEAEIIIDELEAKGLNYSVGLGQVNKSNFKAYGKDGKKLLNACENLKVSADILSQCYKNSPTGSVAEALSCYYAGNYSYGFVQERIGKTGNYSAYVERVINNFDPINKGGVVVPSLESEIPQALSRVRLPKKKNASVNKCFDPNYVWNAEDYKSVCILGIKGGSPTLEKIPQKTSKTVTLTAKRLDDDNPKKLIKSVVSLNTEQVKVNQKIFRF